MARDKAEELETGRRMLTESLLEQAGYTMELARSEAALLAPFGVTKATLDSAKELCGKISAGREDRAVASIDSQSSAAAQNEAFAKAKTWLRRAVLLGKAAYDGDHHIVDEFTKGGDPGSSVKKLTGRLKDVLGALKTDKKRAAAFGITDAFLKTGADLLATLESTDATQETKHANLPKGTEQLYLNKARLYFILKQINRLGGAAHIEDRTLAERYNLDILYRRGTARKGKDKVPVGAGEAKG
ncbi:MAG: hypothetical protein K8T20_08200 [Planctomycetes bacterium]|nr:hypothetical protein [Planctomycetota bacterium]